MIQLFSFDLSGVITLHNGNLLAAVGHHDDETMSLALLLR